MAARVEGLGPLEPLLADPTVTEVMVNGPGPVWIERDGRLERVDVALDNATIGLLIERVVGPLGLRVDRASPLVDARLADGSRVNVVVPPLAIDGPCVTIRRFGTRRITLDEVCPPGVAALLAWAVRARCNVVVSGGTGAGKTTLLNALAAAIPAGERVVTIEDAAELRLPGDHVVRLESRPPNAEGAGAVDIRELVRNALRMRPDRIVVGEVRGPEALDMLQAMNTGHEGSLSTCHANGPADALRRTGDDGPDRLGPASPRRRAGADRGRRRPGGPGRPPGRRQPPGGRGGRSGARVGGGPPAPEPRQRRGRGGPARPRPRAPEAGPPGPEWLVRR